MKQDIKPIFVCLKEGDALLKALVLIPLKNFFLGTITLVQVLGLVFKRRVSRFEFKSEIFNFLHLWSRYHKT